MRTQRNKGKEKKEKDTNKNKIRLFYSAGPIWLGP
jgi:hypothetical protein